MILTQRGKVCHKEIDNVIKNLQSELNEMKHKYLAVLNKIKHEIKRILSKIKKTNNNIDLINAFLKSAMRRH